MLNMADQAFSCSPSVWSRRGVLCAGALVVLLGSDARVAAGQSDDSAAARVDRVFAPWGHAGSPGCAVAVSHDGRVVLERGYGMANLEYDVPITPATIFESGSVAKQFMSAAIVLLAQEGKLSLDDDIRKYLPEMPDFRATYGRPVTIREMLHHTSGLRDFYSLVSLAGRPIGLHVYTNAELLEMESRQRALDFPPDDEYAYTSTNYHLLSIVVERLTGMSLPAFTKARLFDPLGMTHTRWRDDFTRIDKGRATAYRTRSDGVVVADMPFTNLFGGGGLLTTVGDLLRWDANLTDPRVGGRAMVDTMVTRGRLTSGRTIPYALGLVVGTYDGVPEISHEGATGGYRTFLGRYPAQGLDVAVLCNWGAIDAPGVGHQVADIYLPAASRPSVAPTAESPTLTTSEVAARAGVYRSQRLRALLEIELHGTQLVLAGYPSRALVALSASHFRVANGEADIEFESTPDGVTAAKWTGAEGDTARWVRLRPVQRTSGELAAYTGEYRSPEIETTYVIAVDSGQLVARLHGVVVERLTPMYPDGFATAAGTIEFTRSAGAGHRITGFRIGEGSLRDLRFERVITADHTS
jgi:CubicO group peptidase (beta-lactamase class C family)